VGQIGYYGSKRFSVSDKLINTFNGFQRTTSARFETLDRIGLKPLTEYVGPGLDTVSFTIDVNVMLGVNPRQELDEWKEIAASGDPFALCIGNKLLGTDLWALKTAAETWDKIDGNGNVLTGTIALTFEEYVST
jgi:phage protein U